MVTLLGNWNFQCVRSTRIKATVLPTWKICKKNWEKVCWFCALQNCNLQFFGKFNPFHFTSKVGNTVTATYFFVRIVWEIGFLYVTKNLGIVDFDKNYLAESFMKQNVSGLDLIWKKNLVLASMVRLCFKKTMVLFTINLVCMIFFQKSDVQHFSYFFFYKKKVMHCSYGNICHCDWKNNNELELH